VSAHSAGAYTATLLVMVNVMKVVGVHPPPSPARANFTLMTECTPESSGFYSVYSVVLTVKNKRISLSKTLSMYSYADTREH
jgi:hypothetical protein